MHIVDLATQPAALRDAAAQLLVDEFTTPDGWQSLDAARETVDDVLRDGFARAAIAGDRLAGWIGALSEYRGRVWELHPLVVAPEFRRQGVGRALVAALENEVRERGGITVTLGTDDDDGRTSLSGVDLYPNVLAHLGQLRDLGREHPFLFYLKLGYVVTGVLPDANGAGKPDIFMSKRVTQR
jgi:aminoglycoside 6'-N-acetyltransferase I